ncbi:AMP-dependent synthetase/ligase [Sulfurovum sp.]|uniref:AMP-dependent synthetase/ligase n=1 Tax=Sulfurovum sp. TaxID=1969726 RepID=UPI0025F28326|nr:AMP-dependent synthetase/ligase [Sulfurovum sp.]
MSIAYRHFGELFRYLESAPAKKDFLHHRHAGEWVDINKTDFLSLVRALTVAFHHKGWKGKQVAIAITPSSYWLVLDYALMLCGAVSVPLFTNISSRNLFFELLDANIQTVFANSDEAAVRIEKYDTSIEIIYTENTRSGYMHLRTMIEEGRRIDKKNPTLFDQLLSRIDQDDLATIIYTSGTSGTPKGVELTHRNLISQIHATAENYHLDRTSDTALSVLPLAHIFERMVMHFYLSQELSVYFADDVKNVAALLKEINPTVMTAVPRLLEKVFFKMRDKALEGNILKQILVRFAFYRATTKAPEDTIYFLDSTLERLVYRKLKLAFGTEISMMISGGAALSDRLYRFYLNIGIPLYQGYGLTESSPVICANTPKNNKTGTCGKAFPGVEVKISAEGELLARGDNIMRGYHNDRKATAEVIDSEGWLHTGDLASIQEDGFITISGRKKELLKTSTGEFVSAVYIEQLLLANGWFEHALVIGDQKPFVVALLFVDPDFIGRVADRHKHTPVSVLKSDRFRTMVQRYIEKINRKLNHWEKIRDFRFIDRTPTIESGELTPSMKLAKEHLMQRYEALIREMYKDHL